MSHLQTRGGTNGNEGGRRDVPFVPQKFGEPAASLRDHQRRLDCAPLAQRGVHQVDRFRGVSVSGRELSARARHQRFQRRSRDELRPRVDFTECYQLEMDFDSLPLICQQFGVTFPQV